MVGDDVEGVEALVQPEGDYLLRLGIPFHRHVLALEEILDGL